jgi:hypothetical protein
MPIPSRASKRQAKPMIHHKIVVTVGQGDRTASTGANKKLAPKYHAEPVRSDAITKRSHRGTGDSAG